MYFRVTHTLKIKVEKIFLQNVLVMTVVFFVLNNYCFINCLYKIIKKLFRMNIENHSILNLHLRKDRENIEMMISLTYLEKKVGSPTTRL